MAVLYYPKKHETLWGAILMLGQRRRSALKQHRAHVSRSLGNLHQSGFFQANFPRIERCIHLKK